MASMSKHDLNTNNEDMMQKPKFQDQYFSVTAKNIKEATAQETMAMNQNNEIMWMNTNLRVILNMMW